MFRSHKDHKNAANKHANQQGGHLGNVAQGERFKGRNTGRVWAQCCGRAAGGVFTGVCGGCRTLRGAGRAAGEWLSCFLTCSSAVLSFAL